VLELRFECESLCWDRYLRVDHCFGTDSGVWSGVLGPITEFGVLCLKDI